jgi:ComF family protein
VGETAAGTPRRGARASLLALLDLLFPPRCSGCGKPGSIWCQDCQTDVQRLRGPFCSFCGAPTRSHVRTCSQCRHLEHRLHARSYALYRPPLTAAILHLKYRPDRRLASLMGDWLAATFKRAGWDISLIVPVPLAPDRMRRRGYNQAELLSRALADRIHVLHKPDGLVRLRSTPSQVGLDHRQRAANVAGAFGADPSVSGERVLVVDDLCTTGATLRSCVRALRDAGACDGFGLTVARARGGEAFAT